MSFGDPNDRHERCCEEDESSGSKSISRADHTVSSSLTIKQPHSSFSGVFQEGAVVSRLWVGDVG